ncbi:glycerophosphodiester phosphodiesterase [Haoranjiania flava]|uniref:Glycerophosphodiester phosphodiesterase family protein n=2 Tax=Haoranjiania flava TaxID=1856322 RepID=A0AAE3IQ57_9BACT|nr:glycerophosphodiester phosphodiesterase family protein [Haoranjiania flava]MCU7693767.1 glycerophosphodiester phosphodiesterase family protein [Haoranjiania flava]
MKCIIILSAVLLFSCTSMKQGKIPADNPVIAHRGAFKQLNLPENSIASLKHAVALGCAGTEFDVHMTADNVLVLNHDHDYFKLPIEKTDYAALNRHKLGNGESLPLLKDAIQEGMKNNKTTKLICEIKPSSISKLRGQQMAEKVLALVKELKAEKYMVYISFDFDILKKILALNPHANTQYLNGDKSPLELKQAGIRGADYHYDIFRKNPGWIKMAKDHNIALNAWTVNDAEGMKWLLDNNFEYITTNEPEELFRIIDERRGK